MIRSAFLLAAAAFPLSAAITLPAGTELELRLRSKLSSAQCKLKDPVESVLVRPVIVDDQIAIPAGAIIHGEVRRCSPAKPEERAALELSFSSFASAPLKGKTVEARLIEVDNARESVDEKGVILGILASETLSAQMDKAIAKVSARSSGVGSVLQAARAAMFKDPVPEITYEPGVEFRLQLTKPLQIEAALPEPVPGPAPIGPADRLFEFVNAQPFQTRAENPPLSSDITNLMFVGSEQQLTDAFKAAGWDTAASLTTEAKLEVVRAVVEGRGYKEAPMSILLLEDSKPDLVFQKQNNTFARRHHLRIWRRPSTFMERPVWVCAATHDIGIELSAEHRTFIHRIDSRIDAERSKVVNDLVFTGKIQGLSLVDRPKVPTQSQNATGDKIETDGRMAVLILN